MAQRSSRRRPGRPKASEGLATRQQLLDAALELFASQGYTATTVRQIAGSIGVTDAAIYAHFSGKQEIYGTLLREAGPSLLTGQGYDPDEMGRLDPAQILPVVFEGLVSAWDRPRVRLFTSVLLRETSPDIRASLHTARSFLRPVLETWIRNGRLRDDVDVDLLTWELIAPLATIRLTMLTASSSEEDRETGRVLARSHIDYFLMTARPGGA